MSVNAQPSQPVLTSPRQTNSVPSSSPMPPNIANVVLGNLHIKPWYPSFYPEELIGGRRAEWLYVCRWCFKYTPEIVKFVGHCKGAYAKRLRLGNDGRDESDGTAACEAKDESPPGESVYEKDGLAIHEIDGEDYKVCLMYKEDHTTPKAHGSVHLALRSKPLPFLKTLSGNQIRLFRREHFPLLHPRSPAHHPRRESREPSRSSRWLLQQREDVLGQQQCGMHPRLSTLATKRTRTDLDSCLLRIGQA
jgi:hypothetical protein